MTVWVPHDDGTKDFSDAVRFGDISVISRKFLYPDEFGESDNVSPGFNLPVHAKTALWSAAYHYDGFADYVMPYGDLVQVTYFISCLMRLKKNVRVLRYDRHEQAYMAVMINDQQVPPFQPR